ncbi:unnamed protein product [Bursaphelenchus xylophilus]|uniref:(pine wood nematode) hypothetical protein n=1 Tax=Bursaphelenchus xylophilus TaxID=6326 RepID=A0A1I7RUV0_BURXY|nr:unnamed protein product [Bursaphelenchus xylophilus]CAG9105413.1 unnamed protein product [Bursaphelenchus xylophilus]
MEVSTVDIQQLYDLQGTPIKVELQSATRAKEIYGNLYTVDPDTRNLVIAQFNEEDKVSPSKLLLIPSYSIKLVHELTGIDEFPETSGTVDNLIEQIDQRFAQKPEENEPEGLVQGRKQALLDHLNAQNVPFEETEKTIKVGPVIIEYPYNKQSMISENLVALERTQKVLANVLQ